MARPARTSRSTSRATQDEVLGQAPSRPTPGSVGLRRTRRTRRPVASFPISPAASQRSETRLASPEAPLVAPGPGRQARAAGAHPRLHDPSAACVRLPQPLGRGGGSPLRALAARGPTRAARVRTMMVGRGEESWPTPTTIVSPRSTPAFWRSSRQASTCTSDPSASSIRARSRATTAASTSIRSCVSPRRVCSGRRGSARSSGPRPSRITRSGWTTRTSTSSITCVTPRCRCPATNVS